MTERHGSEVRRAALRWIAGWNVGRTVGWTGWTGAGRGGFHPARTARAGFVAAALLFAAPGDVAPAAAAVPDSPADFSAPLDLTHPLHPVVPGAVKVYAGTEHGRALTVVESHLAETRAFEWGAGVVECRVLEEMSFRRGVLVARDRFFVAQADDGSVWAFGEVSDPEVEDGESEGEDEAGGWIVGALAPGDPLDTISVDGPALVMPASPEAGDEWMPEVAAPELVKAARAVSLRSEFRSAAGRFPGCLRVRETDLVDGERESLWYAPGVGLVGTRQPGERLSLRASTLRPAPAARGASAGNR